MGKKTEKQPQKQSKKKEQQKKTDQPTESKIKGRKNKKTESNDDLQLFPKQIHERYSGFTNLYSQINSLNEKAGRTDSFNLTEKTQQLAIKIRDSCTQVFKDQIQQAEAWIEGARDEIKTQIQQLQKSQGKIVSILTETNEFSDEQIKNSLSTLRGKLEVKWADLKKYQDLLAKANDLKSTDSA